MLLLAERRRPRSLTGRGGRNLCAGVDDLLPPPPCGLRWCLSTIRLGPLPLLVEKPPATPPILQRDPVTLTLERPPAPFRPHRSGRCLSSREGRLLSRCFAASVGAYPGGLLPPCHATVAAASHIGETTSFSGAPRRRPLPLFRGDLRCPPALRRWPPCRRSLQA